MRVIVILIGLLITAFSGCLDSDADTDSAGDTGDEFHADIAVPSPLREEGTLQGVYGTTGCTLDARSCRDVPLELTHEWRVDISLTSRDGTASGAGCAFYCTDYDLFLYDAGGRLLGESVEPAGTVDTISTVLAPGSYVIHVLAWHSVVDGNFLLEVEFSAP